MVLRIDIIGLVIERRNRYRDIYIEKLGLDGLWIFRWSNVIYLIIENFGVFIMYSKGLVCFGKGFL